ncbi:MAG: hypothetical protein ACLPTZ_17215 [Beijerinckiaceae bacterium]|jgi:hypothetical protein
MTKYDLTDPRLNDPIGRIDYIKSVMAPDADRLGHAFESFAKQNIGDPATHGFYRRMATCSRDFHSHLVQILGTMPTSLRPPQ